MSNKTIKILMVALFAIAALVVGRVAVLINKTFNPATARIHALPAVDYEETDDFDHDGLDNGEEAVWRSDPYNPDSDGDGFLDGEEVLSDHNPTLAGNDSLDKARAFLALSSTERLAQAIAGGIVSGELDPNTDISIYAQSVDTVAESTVYSVLSALENIEIDEVIESTAEDTTANREQYLKDIFKIISGDLLDIVFNQPKELVLLLTPDLSYSGPGIYDSAQKERVKSKFLQHSIEFQQAYDKLAALDVPQSWAAIHTKTLTLLKKLEMYHRSIALGVDDPLKQMVVLGNLQSVYLEAQPILTEIDAKIKRQNLTPPDSDFFNISLLLTK